MKIRWWIIGLIVFIAALFVWQKFSDPNRALVKKWKAAGVECLASHERAALHFHPQLKIELDGQSQTIPPNIGIVTGCMAEIHTHDSSGTIHVETTLTQKKMHLKHFFAVWDKPFSKSGYNLEMLVDNAASTAGGDLILKDGQQIILRYSQE